MVGAATPPDEGDVVWLDFSPTLGHEQGGRRPALVLSPRIYNDQTGLAVVCPITNQVKGYPFEVSIPNETVTGAILVNQIRSLDWTTRNIKHIDSVSGDVLHEVGEWLSALMPIYGD